MELKELFKYREIELKKILGEDTYLKPNSLIIHKGNGNNKRISKLLARKGKIGFTDNRDTIYLEDYKRVNFNTFLELKHSWYNFHYQPKTAQQLIKLLKDKLSKYYSLDRLDIKSLGNYSDEIRVIIYYPEITITNELGSTHKITDIYMSYDFQVNTEGIRLRNILIYRNSFTIGEYAEEYIFSHISAPLGSTSANFCFGKTVLDKAIDKFYNSIQYNEILSFIFSVEEYLTWESLQGVPYRYIDKIKEFEVKGKYFDIPFDLVNALYKYTLNKLYSFKYDFFLENGKDTIILAQQSKDDINNILKEYLLLNNPEYIQRQIGDSFGTIQKYSNDYFESINNRISSYEFEFKGEILTPKVNRVKIDIEELNNKYPKVVCSELQKQVFERIETEFIEYLIRFKQNLL